ncbi:MAG: flippase-like domain-containing protein [Nevskia sp.]|nr:flippase-like domain-containing protein [Nevskia sp.]
MKSAMYIAGLLGLAAMTALVLHQGLGGVLTLLRSAGWYLLLLVPFHALPLLLDAAGWRTLLAPRDPEQRARLPFLLWVAAVREAVSRLLPTLSAGGEIAGIRLVKLRGLDGAATTASVIVEVLLTLIGQYIFAALGVVLLIAATAPTHVAWTILSALALSLPVPILLGALLRYGSVFERLGKLAETTLGSRSRLVELIGGSSLDAEIRALYKRPGRLLTALAWELCGFVLGALETWLALRFLGHPAGVGTAIVIESLTQALRSIAFIVPAGLGVQEGGLMVFGSLVGIGGDLSISLSLAKRMRELLFGVPALLSWLWVEGRRLKLSLPGKSSDQEFRQP